MRLGSSTDKKDSGRLHVDFAQARDDFYEWECRQRMRAREERHRRKLEEDRLRPPSPPAIMHYSEHEAALLAEKLKGRRPAGGWGAPPPPMRARPPTGSGRRPPTRARPGRFSRAFTCQPRGGAGGLEAGHPGVVGQSPAPPQRLATALCAWACAVCPSRSCRTGAGGPPGAGCDARAPASAPTPGAYAPEALAGGQKKRVGRGSQSSEMELKGRS